VGIYLETVRDNVFLDNDLVDNGRNALFSALIDIPNKENPVRPFHNVWHGNYWSDWQQSLPRPIRGTITVFLRFGHLPLFDVPWLMFDWHPAAEPYGW